VYVPPQTTHLVKRCGGDSYSQTGGVFFSIFSSS
jgi:hypothetical protein